MIPALRRWAAPVALVILGSVIGIGLASGGEVEPTVEDRVDQIAANLRCPFCGGVSIAESTSSIARDLRGFITEQVGAGATDQEVYDYFVARYTERVLLRPVWSGWGLVLWAVPFVAVAVGVIAIRSRRRGRVAVPAGDVVDQLDHVRRDLGELELQEAAGELTPAVAGRLRASYLEEELAVAAAGAQGETADAPRKVDRKRLIGAGILVVGGAAVTLAVIGAVADRDPSGLITGGVFQEADDPVDLATVTNEELEQVVAENPDVVGMRLALARRYFQAGDFTAALPHFLGVLDRELNAEALASVGWMTYLSDEPDIAEDYVERSIEVEPDFPQAYWYLGNIRLLGLADPGGAIDPLERLLTYELPDDVRTEAEELLDVAEAEL
ncbi:MAG TPA: cytochrome c-type biogenesis protein CcmH [Acidimicrobiia bacterium]